MTQKSNTEVNISAEIPDRWEPLLERAQARFGKDPGELGAAELAGLKAELARELEADWREWGVI